LERLKDLADGSVDSIVTDPPYELGFMGKAWDASGIAYNVELWRECLRVLKPGGHLLAFGGTRTYHRMAVAIEDAGFEIRDSIHWVYGSGFPKSLDVSKAIDKQAGAKREIVGKRLTGSAKIARAQRDLSTGGTDFGSGQNLVDITAPATPAAQQWQGWGTALKPAHEPIVLARKPLDGTVAANVLGHGTGALNIDGCRIGSAGGTKKGAQGQRRNGDNADFTTGGTVVPLQEGRWPANIIFDEAAGAELDAQSGLEASRFFYCPKPGKKERNAGLDELPKVRGTAVTGRAPGSAGQGNGKYAGTTETPRANIHPTVKPVALMRYLVRLITPPGGTVLDPFLGSGTTAVAAILEDMQWIGCEMTKDYLPIIRGRVQWAQRQPRQLPHG